MDCTDHGILQARILEWVAFPFSRGSFQPRDRNQVSCIAGGFFTKWTTNDDIFFIKRKDGYLESYKGRVERVLKYLSFADEEETQLT